MKVCILRGGKLSLGGETRKWTGEGEVYQEWKLSLLAGIGAKGAEEVHFSRRGGEGNSQERSYRSGMGRERNSLGGKEGDFGRDLWGPWPAPKKKKKERGWNLRSFTEKGKSNFYSNEPGGVSFFIKRKGKGDRYEPPKEVGPLSQTR